MLNQLVLNIDDPATRIWDLVYKGHKSRPLITFTNLVNKLKSGLIVMEKCRPTSMCFIKICEINIV